MPDEDLIKCGCGRVAAWQTHDERPLCDDCNPGLNAPHSQAPRVPWPPEYLERIRKRRELPGEDEDGELGDLFNLLQARWLTTVEQAERGKAELYDIAVTLLVSLPRCEHCAAPATKAWERGAERYCDEHGEGVPDYPRAPYVRALQAYVREGPK